MTKSEMFIRIKCGTFEFLTSRGILNGMYEIENPPINEQLVLDFFLVI